MSVNTHSLNEQASSIGDERLADKECPVRVSDWPSAYRLWGTRINPVTMSQAVSRIQAWIDDGLPNCRFVVTPNVDHVVQLHRQPELRWIYKNASMTLADGWPLVAMSRFYAKRLPERVAGSDLVPAVCEHFQSQSHRLRLFLLGGMPGIPERAADRIGASWPLADVVGMRSPPLGFEHDEGQNQEIVDAINASDADVLVLGLGFPKQERWINKHAGALRVPVALCVGATIDFLAGEQTRAPLWVQYLKMEWLHRVLSDPRRLAARYATDAIYFPFLCLKEFCDTLAYPAKS